MALVLRPPVERESLPVQLSDIGRARKRVALAAGLFALVATGVGGVTLAAALDAAVHLAPLPRAALLVLLLAAAGTVWLRGVGRALRFRTDAGAIALELEGQFPNLNDALASAVDFLGPPQAGVENELPRPMPGVSDRLTASAVRAAERKASRLPLDQIVLTGKCWRAAWLCAAALAVALPLGLWNTARSATALARLADPFGAHPWPTRTRIEVVTPDRFPARLSKGDPFELKFAVRGELTGPATVRVRAENGAEFEEQYPLSLGTDARVPGAAVVAARFEAGRVPADFAVRVTANDGDTDWLDVTVVPAPRLVPLDGRPSPQFHAAPPAYTGLPDAQLPDGAAVIEVPTGTALRFRAATDVRLSAAALGYDRESPANRATRDAVSTAAPLAALGHTHPLAAVAADRLAAAVGADVPVAVDDGTRLALDFVPLLSGTYALKLTDDTGLTGTRLLEIRLIPDPVPLVTLARPQAGLDPPLLTPGSSVTVQSTAEDKLYGVRRSFVEYRVGRDGAVRTVPLAHTATPHPAALAAAGGGAALAPLPPGAAVETTRTVPLAAFRRDDGTPVREGDVLFLRTAADDWDDVAALKGPGRSAAEVEIRVAAPEAIEAWLQRELAALRPELIRLREHQRDARQKVTDVVPQPSGAVAPDDRDKLIAAEQLQHLVRGKLADPRDGLRTKAEVLRATARANDLPRSNTTDRVEVLAAELGRTADRDLGTTDQALADARQLAGQPPQPGQAQQLADLLRKTARHQKSVEDTATAMLDLLSQWGGAGEIRGEAVTQRNELFRQLAANEHLKDRAGKQKLTADEQREMDRAAGKAAQAAAQGGQLIDRATALAADKTKQAAELRGRAAAKDAEASDLRARAAETDNPVEKSALAAQADAAAAAAADLRAAADKADAEAAALRKGLAAVGGLKEDLTAAAKALGQNQQGRSGELMRGAAKSLDDLAAALTETAPDAAPELAKKKNLRGAADQLNALADLQDELRKKAAAAAQIADPEKRRQALQELAKEQDKLIDRGRELLQKLTRERADDAARDGRAALDKMEAAREDLEKGRAAARPLDEAVDKLDAARDRLDAAAAAAGRQLSDEKRRKLADQVKALLERQKAAVAEAKRVHAEAAAAKGWDRPLRQSYADLEEVREQEIAVEARKLADAEFAPLPVLARLLTDCAGAVDAARARIKARRDEADPAGGFDPEVEALADRRVLRPMELAQKRLEQLVEALKPEDPKKQPDRKNPPQQAQNPPQPNPNGGGGQQDVIPPLAQLKVLRALQDELNKSTADFAKNHPDAGKLTDDEKAELKDLEQAQREIAELFEKMSKLFNREPGGAEGGKDEPKDQQGQEKKEPADGKKGKDDENPR
jgi:hypothetical protein